MQKLEVFIEENAFGSIRPIEIDADKPVAALIPTLVTELQLPRTDLFGRELTYTLRETVEKATLANDATLLACGVRTGTVLALDSYVVDQEQALHISSPLVQAPPRLRGSDQALYASPTIADTDNF